MQSYSGESNRWILWRCRLYLEQIFQFECPAQLVALRSGRLQGQLTADSPEDSQTSETILRNNPETDKPAQVGRDKTDADTAASTDEGK